MYPYVRMFKELFKFRNAPPLGLFDTHVSHHVCWPWDIDPWMELNNGRTLTLYDLGRIPLGQRMGLHKRLAANGWGLTVAGNTTRYRRRVQMFNRVEMRSRVIGWDARFLYIEQSMWRQGDCTSHILIRSAITSKAGIVPPSDMAQAMGHDPQSPALPDWVQNWIAAEASRPWPPQM
ncbi:MAG: thioesterase family protein [Rhodobacteraceae bacterium]|nr:thioesterase family protein [Paracoccaceae bacterium]